MEILKKGVLECLLHESSKQEWKKRYYVLYQPSVSQREAARLDWFGSESDFKHSKSNASTRKTIWLEEIQDISDPASEGKKHIFQLKTHNSNYKLSTDKKTAHDWVKCIRKAMQLQKNHSARLSSGSGSSMQSIGVTSDNGCAVYDENTEYQSVEESLVYNVTVAPTEASIRCCLKGDYRLFLSVMNISVVQAGSTIPELVWPYRYIRRYGKSSSSFTFEAGRRCSSGDGVFTFYTPEGNTIFQKVQDMVRQMRDRERVSGGTQRQSNASVDTGSPNAQRSSGQQRASAGRPPIATPAEPEYAEYDDEAPQPPPPLAVNQRGLHYDKPNLNQQGGAWKDKGVEEEYQPVAGGPGQAVYDEPFTGPGMATLASEFNRLSATKGIPKGQCDTYDHIGPKGNIDKQKGLEDDISYDIPQRDSRNANYSQEGEYDQAVSVSRSSRGKLKSVPAVEEGMYDEITPQSRKQ